MSAPFEGVTAHGHGEPLVGVIMGSRSDWDMMRRAAEVLGLTPEQRAEILEAAAEASLDN